MVARSTRDVVVVGRVEERYAPCAAAASVAGGATCRQGQACTRRKLANSHAPLRWLGTSGGEDRAQWACGGRRAWVASRRHGTARRRDQPSARGAVRPASSPKITAAKATPTMPSRPRTGTWPESRVEWGVRRPASPHLSTEARSEACCSAAGMRKTMTKLGSPQSARSVGTSSSSAAPTSGGSAHRGAARRREPKWPGSTAARLAASTPLKRGNAAVATSMGNKTIHAPTTLAQMGVGASGGAACR
eukprot:scaffold108166_cov28-Tisochrysis_lutea.AAC.2